MTTTATTDFATLTADWTRNASDTLAVGNGCRFNVRKAAYAAWWIERFCHLYEDEHAGEPLILRGCHDCLQYGIEVPEEFSGDGEEACLERAEQYANCVREGHRVGWQYDCTMRVFGWETFNRFRNRWVRRFREASIWVPKKSGKSPSIAAWGMYLLIGDEVPGQKVFLAAKDGQQVKKNVALHAMEMVNRSPELSDVCTINKTESYIKHEPSTSFMLPLSSSNERTTKSKEGLNGSFLVDETHVVDREYMSRVSRAGISRAEPLHAEFSTAGDDPDSYGKERFDMACKVASGAEELQTMFAAVYAAPQELSDTDLESDPMKWAMMANPAIGHTVDPAELLSDYNASRKTPAKLAEFKMYRLNIWQNAASPWLSMHEWMKGQRDFLPEDFEGRECWAALDLSQTRDFSALTLAFPEPDDAYALFWWFWYPQDRATEVQHLIPIQSWISDPRCNLTLTPGNVIDYGWIASTFRKLCKQFSIQELSYDGWNAEQLTQELEQGRRDESGVLIEEGTGVPRLKFPQGLQVFNEPTKRFEVAVSNEQILHNNRLATWMVGNATVKADHNGNYKPLKPKHSGSKHIDGVITAIMSHRRADQGERTTSVYERERRSFVEIG